MIHGDDHGHFVGGKPAIFTGLLVIKEGTNTLTGVSEHRLNNSQKH